MFRLLLFVGLPLLEMAVLIWAGSRIGLGATLALILLTGVAGATLVKRQGLAVWASARQRLATGALPTEEMVHGAMLVVSGAFLLTPGFLTDLAGFALLVPLIRHWLQRRFGGWASRRFAEGPTRVEVWRV